MGSAAQSFRYARLRRSRSAVQPDAETSQGSTSANDNSTQQQLESVTGGPSPAAAVQPLVVAGLAPNDLTTLTTVAGAPAGKLQLKERVPEAAAAAVDPPVFLDRRSRPRNGKSVRALNVTIAAVSLIVLSPVMLLLAIAVRLTSKGPIIYKQVRVGRDRRRYDNLSPADRRAIDARHPRAGRAVRANARQAQSDRRMYNKAVAVERRRGTDRRATQAEARADARRRRIANAVHDRRVWNACGQSFTMYKFRTMRVDAEAGTGAVWAQKKDPRVTPIGGFLRKCRLDELPQLLNVLKGDMNIVGPRPERPTIVPNLVEKIGYYPIRQRTRPGITGLAQIRHSYDASIDDVKAKVWYDLEYLRRRSVLQDLRIMVQTPLVMFFKRSGQ
ncbi:MAG TPA: sugar transferase [Gemmatimonadaceae bacterium]|nr:sugar transferase [Gemmatimonadaceae bacterium]